MKTKMLKDLLKESKYEPLKYIQKHRQNILSKLLIGQLIADQRMQEIAEFADQSICFATGQMILFILTLGLYKTI
jgi:hypothetical protein